MTVQIIRPNLVEAPVPERRSYGLLDVAEVRDGIEWLDSNDMFVSWNCVDTSGTLVCGPDSTPTKTFSAATLVDGANFVVYLGGQCKPLTETAHTRSGIDRVFDLRESKAVEKAFEAAVLTAGTALAGTSVTAFEALATLEQALAVAYAGVGTIHMSPAVANALFADLMLVEQNGKLYTRLGSKVVVGAGYTTGTMYGTGEVVVYRGSKDVTDAPDMAQNVTNVLAERAYIVVADCISYKIVAPGKPLQQGGGDTPTPTPQMPVSLTTGTYTVAGPGGSWSPPSGNLRNVSVVVTSGSVEVDGEEVTAPHTVSFDADDNETLVPPTVTGSSSNDRAVVAWVVVP